MTLHSILNYSLITLQKGKPAQSASHKIDDLQLCHRDIRNDHILFMLIKMNSQTIDRAGGCNVECPPDRLLIDKR